MDYKKHYDNLISSRNKRICIEGVYYEKHHIIMRSMGGTNDKENIVLLTAREHFIAHYLLWKIYKNNQTAWSFKMMCTRNKKWSAKIYEELRKNMKHSEETKMKISASNKISQIKNPSKGNRRGSKCSEETKMKMRIAQKGKKGPAFSEETIKQMSDVRKGIKFSEEHKKNMSIGMLDRTPWNKGKKHVILKNKKPIYQCDLSGKIIKEWDSAKQVFIELGYSCSGISLCCSGKYLSSNGFIWKYKK
jgi:hypothetical protein